VTGPSDPGAALPPRTDIAWLQPFPDRLWEPVAPSEAQPDAVVVARETIELAFLAAIQHLPPRQRAVLILRDVLGWPAKQTAALLEGSVASVNSALQRARATLKEHLPERRLEWAPSAEPTERERAVLRRYMDAMERADLAAVAHLLAEDVRATMAPWPMWFQGRDAVVASLAASWDVDSPGEVQPGERLPWDDDTLASLPYEHTVHFTLGTLFHGATEVFSTTLAGLRQLPVNVLVTVGPGTDPHRLGPQPPHVLVADFAPHALLLPRCAALVTQGGAGTIVAALCHGLPHLILPQGADQFRNAATAQRAGVALVLPPPQLTPDTVASAARRLLEDPVLTRAAGAAQAEINAMPDADAVLAALTA
jgi:hypothetical protein